MSLPSPTQEAAARAAQRSTDDHAGSAGDSITIRRLATLEEFLEACTIQEETWGAGFSERVPGAILNVAQRIGGVTAAAFGPDGRMLGFVFGLTGFKDGKLVHWSDMLAVRVEARGRHLGDRLKHFQRLRCLEIGVESMLWTFDPLVARNAHFNINRLGARAAEYAADMYGSNTGSTLHGMMPTDRIIASWELRGATPLADVPEHVRRAPVHRDAPIVTPLDDAGVPAFVEADAPVVLVQIPRDIQEVRLADPSLALAWRHATRAALVSYMERGYTVTGFDRGASGSLPAYVMTRA